MLVFEAADAEHEIYGPSIVDDDGGFREHFFEDVVGNAEIFSAEVALKGS